MTKHDEELHAYLTLAMTPHIGPKSFAQILHHFGSASNALSAGFSEIRPYLERSDKAIMALREQQAEPHVQAALKWTQQENCRLMTLLDDDYPMTLAHGIAPAPVLFLRGNDGLLKNQQITIVGSRKATPQGRQIAFDWAKELSSCGICVVSGMALGIDTSAHTGALEGAGGTIAILGTGIDRIYPASNRELAHRIVEHGLLVSEFTLGTPVMAVNFPRRNRIIAGLGRATVVIEASMRSGSLTTARLAGEMGHDVMAVPHAIFNPQGVGCNALLKQGAKLVDCVSDILDEYVDWKSPQHTIQSTPKKPPIILSKNVSKVSSNTQSTVQTSIQVASTLPIDEEDSFLQAMAFDAVYPDELAERLSMDVADVYAHLLTLELNGVVSLCAGGKYQRIISQKC